MAERISLKSIGKHNSGKKRHTVLVLFGTRPEVIKLAPIIHELEGRVRFKPVVVSSSQHTHLLRPFLKLLDVNLDHDLRVMKADQGPNHVCSRVIAKLDAVIETTRPSLLVVQGDTSTTLAGAIAGFNRKVPVAHVEAGLRSGDVMSPFPEEMNRRLVSQIATLHFAATPENKKNLVDEGLTSQVFVSGNPVVDSLERIAANGNPSRHVRALIESMNGQRTILLTTHRRESFASAMGGNLRAIASFVKKRKDVSLVFPVHPNPNVREAAETLLAGKERIHLLKPVDYVDFVALMKAAWLIVSDSGGVQEEAPSLGKPLLILRENTERPEAITSGVAKLVGGDPRKLTEMLEENYRSEEWIRSVSKIPNPFGDGKAAVRITDAIESFLEAK